MVAVPGAAKRHDDAINMITTESVDQVAQQSPAGQVGATCNNNAINSTVTAGQSGNVRARGEEHAVDDCNAPE